MSTPLPFNCSAAQISRSRHPVYSILFKTDWRHRDASTYQARSLRTKPRSAWSDNCYKRPVETVETLSVRALVNAGQCSNHRRRFHNHSSGHIADTSTGLGIEAAARNRQQWNPKPASGASRAELKSLVTGYSNDRLHDILFPAISHAQRDKVHTDVPEPPHLQATNGQIAEHQSTVNQIQTLLENPTSSPEDVYEKYQQLPAPRTAYLRGAMFHKLLRHFAIVEYKTEAGMLRFLDVIGDAKAAGRRISRWEWTSAIAFAGRCFKKLSTEDVANAIHLWKEMELRAGIQASHVTFNVLFDIATRANKFVLAEAIMKEMEQRGLQFNRFFHRGLIYFHGLRGDGDGVRHAYHALVNSGEIVDSGVVSCVIAALLKAGEPDAAEHVFARQKSLHAQKSGGGLPPHHWRERRALDLTLEKLARQHRQDADKHRESYEAVKRMAPLAPNPVTYQVLVYHYAVVAGNLERVVELVREQDFYGIPSNGNVFVYLFNGFYLHGGVLYTAWTWRRLESVWRAFLAALENGAENVYWSFTAARFALLAFHKCAGSARTLEASKEILSAWQPAEEDRLNVEGLVARLVPAYER